MNIYYIIYIYMINKKFHVSQFMRFVLSLGLWLKSTGLHLDSTVPSHRQPAGKLKLQIKDMMMDSMELSV